MRKSRKRGPVADLGGTRSREGILDWLARRIDFERAPPGRSKGAVFNLGRVRRLLAAVNAPHERLRVVHVAGTKGKGSTVAMIAAILREAGHRVGRYMSPHVHRLEERICVDGEPISEADLVACFATVIPAVEALDAAAGGRRSRRPTWFEIVTAAALVHFDRAGVDVAVLETGLGGRLDATNVVRPLVSVITSISLDHMAILGPTVARIAAEKAGIIKPGRPVISGAMHPAARRVIAATAARRRSPLLQAGRDFRAAFVPGTDADGPLGTAFVDVTDPSREDGRATSRYRVGMAGRHQADNAALAVMAARRLDALGITVPERAIVRGLARVRLPARIERVARRPLVVVDAAHNVASMRSLVDTLAPLLEKHRPRVLVFAASGDKQIERMLAVARGGFDHVVVTRYATSQRSAPVERLVRACRRAGLPAPDVADSPREALARGVSLATRRGLVCVAGSFFLAAEVGLP